MYEAGFNPLMEQLNDIDYAPIPFNWTPDEKFRAKLYQLDPDGRWQDLGTGYFSIEFKGEGQYQMSLI